MGSLKDALQKAGFKPTFNENERPKKNRRSKKKIHDHQVHRNFCEHCELTLPDVEHYKHRNPTVRARWMCVLCADKNEILDDCRQTNQSDTSRKGMFKRSYGATKKF